MRCTGNSMFSRFIFTKIYKASSILTKYQKTLCMSTIYSIIYPKCQPGSTRLLINIYQCLTMVSCKLNQKITTCGMLTRGYMQFQYNDNLSGQAACMHGINEGLCTLLVSQIQGSARKPDWFTKCLMKIDQNTRKDAQQDFNCKLYITKNSQNLNIYQLPIISIQ